MASDVALKEVAHAASLNKRFAPIVCRRVDDGAVPGRVRRLNFIFFDDPARFEASADALPRRCRPTSAGSGSTPSSAKQRGAGRPGPAGRLAAALAGAGGSRALDLRHARVARPEPTEDNPSLRRRRAGAGRPGGATSSPAASRPDLSVALALAGLAYGSEDEQRPKQNASAPKTRSRPQPRPPTVWCSIWRNGSATATAYQPT